MSADTSIDQERIRQFDRTYPKLLSALLNVAKSWDLDPPDPHNLDRGITAAYATIWAYAQSSVLWLPAIVDNHNNLIDVKTQERIGLLLGDTVFSSSGKMSLSEFEAMVIADTETQFADFLRNSPYLRVDISRTNSVPSNVPPADTDGVVDYLLELVSQANAEDLDQSTQAAVGNKAPRL